MSLNFLFSLILMMGTLITLSSSSWFIAWMGLEINLMSFIPLLMINKSQQSMESSMKYFLSQSMASSFLMLGILTMNHNHMWISQNHSLIIMISALTLKLGAAPFHFWFPAVMANAQWMMCVILMTWQKIGPLSLIMTTSSSFLLLPIIASAMVGSLGGFNQTQMKNIMTYSSIGHLSWMLTINMMSEKMMIIYFLVYSILTMSISFSFLNLNINHITQIPLFNKNNKINLILSINMMSLGGLPPFLGFVPKWMVIQNLMMNSFFMLSLILIMSSLITLYYYLRILYFSTMMSSPTLSWMNFQPNLTNPMIMTIPSLMSFPMMLILYLI